MKFAESNISIAEDGETRFNTSNYELDRPLLKGKNKKVIILMKDKLDEKIIAKLVELREKTYSYLIDGGNEDKKDKASKKCVIKREIKFENCLENCLEATQLENNINYLEQNKINLDSLKKDHKEFIKEQ